MIPGGINRAMRQTLVRFAAASGLLLAATTAAQAQVTVTLPSTTQTTTLTATVAEQANVTVPTAVTFAVADVSSSTAATAASVTATSVVLSSASKQLKISLQANAASFTPPSGAVTWNASDVTWNAATWTNATGVTGTLSNAVYNTVATCTAGAGSCNTTGLVFTLAANPSIVRSGNYTLVVTWKFESI
jgi:hypothetical protein